ncbi:Fur-regulated basic protein FbpA [Fictibacillus sp. Mic-4]|uniref:Fur-regulated basic protein FbpA n=1 Tax=Fictibacillus TaxID=1329200 RepID=UPI0003F6A990|nr:Fur-regulated basic protein FbpA [Fictibacillus gelatini]
MGELSKAVKKRKDELINKLILHHVYKASDGSQLYELPLKDLEREYELVKENSKTQIQR